MKVSIQTTKLYPCVFFILFWGLLGICIDSLVASDDLDQEWSYSSVSRTVKMNVDSIDEDIQQLREDFRASLSAIDFACLPLQEQIRILRLVETYSIDEIVMVNGVTAHQRSISVLTGILEKIEPLCPDNSSTRKEQSFIFSSKPNRSSEYISGQSDNPIDGNGLDVWRKPIENCLRDIDFHDIDATQQYSILASLIKVSHHIDFQSLTIRNCGRLNCQLFHSMRIVQLEFLDLSGCSSLDDNLGSKLKEASSLVYLNLSSMSSLTKIAPLKLVPSAVVWGLPFPKLTTLVLDGAENLRALKIKAPDLQKLSLINCGQVAAADIESLLTLNDKLVLVWTGSKDSPGLHRIADKYTENGKALGDDNLLQIAVGLYLQSAHWGSEPGKAVYKFIAMTQEFPHLKYDLRDVNDALKPFTDTSIMVFRAEALKKSGNIKEFLECIIQTIFQSKAKLKKLGPASKWATSTTKLKKKFRDTTFDSDVLDWVKYFIETENNVLQKAGQLLGIELTGQENELVELARFVERNQKLDKAEIDGVSIEDQWSQVRQAIGEQCYQTAQVLELEGDGDLQQQALVAKLLQKAKDLGYQFASELVDAPQALILEPDAQP